MKTNPKSKLPVDMQEAKKTQKTAIAEVERSEVETPEEVAERTRTQLAQYKLDPKQKIEIRDPLTGETKLITLDRTGHSEQNLIVALANPDIPRDQKDHAISMYLFQRGAESASMIVDIMRYKGQHTKETRVFKSQMRFDLENFVSAMARHLREQAERTARIYDLHLREEMGAYRDWLKLPNNKDAENELTYWDFYQTTHPKGTRADAALLSQAIFDIDKALYFEDYQRKIAQAREAEKGGGVYVDRSGKAYSSNDPEIDELIKAEREALKEDEKNDR